jgi:hypothetical protein
MKLIVFAVLGVVMLTVGALFINLYPRFDTLAFALGVGLVFGGALLAVGCVLRLVIRQRSDSL